MHLRMKYFYYFFLLLFFLLEGKSANANHIVGGEFSLIHIEGYNYRLVLTQYRDALQEANTFIEPEIEVRIFRKRDNMILADVRLGLTGSEDLDYTSPACTDEYIKTKKVVYSAVINLDPDIFKDAAGYYVAWERCCRNNSINNIVLERENTVGQTYYLEFPAVAKGDKQFINSSPDSLKALNAYACVGVPYYADFSGVDEDGDSLVYSLVTPFDSSNDSAVAVVKPAPYPPVPWQRGFSDQAMIPGDPTLAVDEKGLLSVRPSMSGLFVFAVLIEEFRDEKKIGEVRRDFQMLVLDCPMQSSPPELVVSVSGDEDFSYETDVATLSNDLADEERCIEVTVSDKESANIAAIRVKPVNFSNPSEVFSVSAGELNENEDSITFQVCFSACPLLDVPYLLDILTSDNACPEPLGDSIRLQVQVETPANQEVYFETPANDMEALVYAGSVFSLPLHVLDNDGDAIDLRLISVGFDTSNYAISLDKLINQAGEIEGVFSWDLKCEDFDFEHENVFSFKFVADDVNACDLGKPDTLNLTVKVADVFADLDGFSIPNVFTPNGDSYNDFFQMCSGQACNGEFILPPDNCEGQFLEIEVFNRWGKLVFKSKERDFRWGGDDLAYGTYYYLLKYTHRAFKGQLSMIK